MADRVAAVITRIELLRDAANAENLVRHGAGNKQEMVGLLRERSDSLTALIGGLIEAQLDAPALLSPAGARSVEMVATTLLATHTQSHLDSIRASVASPAAAPSPR